MSSGVGLLPLVHPGAEAAIAWVGVDFTTPAADEIVIMGLFDYPGSEFLVIHDSNEFGGSLSKEGRCQKFTCDRLGSKGRQRRGAQYICTCLFSSIHPIRFSSLRVEMVQGT